MTDNHNYMRTMLLWLRKYKPMVEVVVGDYDYCSFKGPLRISQLRQGNDTHWNERCYLMVHGDTDEKFASIYFDWEEIQSVTVNQDGTVKISLTKRWELDRYGSEYSNNNDPMPKEKCRG